jgi:hypothetical protein
MFDLYHLQNYYQFSQQAHTVWTQPLSETIRHLRGWRENLVPNPGNLPIPAWATARLYSYRQKSRFIEPFHFRIIAATPDGAKG